ncbi:MAG: prepilin-type N-terminal cleavage/methylation domain-containing protein [SAR324 cluster bacterium]|nr:prepilin-type N-terminal cleavage/methylation domain-containing protein [SAR324 cluster bacterium]
MTLPSTRKRFHGFSLMEVMIVVVIIGILAALAYPSLEKYLKIARQTEAKTNLSAIYTAQKIYFTLHQSYAEDINELDLSLVQGDPYTFTMEASTSTFKAQAEGNIDDDDDALDIWTIDQNKILFNDKDNVTAE